MKHGMLAIAVAFFALATSGTCFATADPATLPLAANSNYSITISKLNVHGALVDLETTSATTDSAGKLAFTLAHIPSKDEANFIIFTIRDGVGTVVRRGLATAPPTNDNNATGLNFLSTTQTDGLIRAAAQIGTDDPIIAAYLLIILRSPGISSSDLDNLAMLAHDALYGADNTFEGYLLPKVGSTVLGNMKSCLIYNPDNSAKTLRNFTRGFFNAVEMVNDNAATSEMQKAGGLMGEIFLDAGICAGIDAGEILAAHNAAGDGAEAGGHMAALSPGLRASIDAGMSAFNRKISIVRISTEYTNALTALNASGAQVTQFLGSVDTMMLATAAIDQTYGGYFQDRTGYLAAHPGTDDNTIQAAMNAAYTAAWTGFQDDIAADNAAILAMKDALTAADNALFLPSDFGTYTDQTGTRKNWPIPQVVLVNWLAGSTFNYAPRDATPIPTMMVQWMGSCDNNWFWNQPSCEGAGNTWTPGRRTYNTGSTVFNAYLGLQEDLNIIQMKRSEIWNNGNQPTGAERALNEALYISRVLATKAHISGSKAGSAITDAQKEAIVKLLLPPQT